MVEIIRRTGRLDYMFNNTGIAMADPAGNHLKDRRGYEKGLYCKMQTRWIPYWYV